MGFRTDLHDVLVNVLGSTNVYFQPPENIKMKYPCIVYEWSSLLTKFADDSPYYKKRQYTVTVIDADPDSLIPEKVAGLPLCKSSGNNFQVDQLNHYPFTLYY